MTFTKDQLVTMLQTLGIKADTVDHTAAPTVDAHTEEINKIPQFKGCGQVKNLVLKAKSGKLFLIACMHDTKVDMKSLTTRLGIKGGPMRMVQTSSIPRSPPPEGSGRDEIPPRISARLLHCPLRPAAPLHRPPGCILHAIEPPLAIQAAADIMQAALGIPAGSVTPFAVVNKATSGGVALLLDEKFKKFPKVLLHPLTNEATTAISPADFEKFVESLGREVEYVDFDNKDDQIVGACPEEPAKEEPKAKQQPAKEKKDKAPKEPVVNTKIPAMVEVPFGAAAGHPEGSITKCPTWLFKEVSWEQSCGQRPVGH